MHTVRPTTLAAMARAVLALAAMLALSGASAVSEQRAAVQRLRAQLLTAERALAQMDPASASGVEKSARVTPMPGAPTTTCSSCATVPPPPGNATLPAGGYKAACSGCRLLGESLTCACNGTHAGGAPVRLELTSCVDRNNVSVTEEGYLVCQWKPTPPPRVGKLTGDTPNVDHITTTCRILEDTTFIAPQFKNPGDPIATHLLGGANASSALAGLSAKDRDDPVLACCAICSKDTRCKAWTLSGGASTTEATACHIATTYSTAFPSKGTTSGYPLRSDAATWCSQLWTIGDGHPWGDMKTATGVTCSKLVPHKFPLPSSKVSGAVNFPRYWRETDQTDPKRYNRGTAWFFLPSSDANATCDCQCAAGDFMCDNMECNAPKLNSADISKNVKGKPWIVFIHGGHFHDCTNNNEHYAMLSSKIAKQAGMGVLAVDYRQLTSTTVTGFPDQLEDVIDAMLWLQARGASELLLYGDSSGSTQVVELLLYLEWKKQNGQDYGITVAAAASFSGWLDTTGSLPTYESRRRCGGDCKGIGSPLGAGSPNSDRITSQCETRAYYKPDTAWPTDFPIVSPLQAPDYLLSKLPPIMLVVGGNEVLLGENFQFAQRAQKAGAAVQLEVYEDMWHDFIQYSEGCGADAPLYEGIDAIQRVSQFLSKKKSCRVVCANGDCSGAAPVTWHFSYNSLPEVSKEECDANE